MLSAASADWLALLTSDSDQCTKLGAAGAAPYMSLVASRWFDAPAGKHIQDIPGRFRVRRALHPSCMNRPHG